MSAVVLCIGDRQSDDVQLRAALACARVEQASRRRPTLDETMGHSFERGITLYPSLDAWYRSLPIPSGRLGPKLVMLAEAKRHYGIPASARLFELRGMGGQVDHWSISKVPVAGGVVVGVKAPFGAGGVGVLWRLPNKANEYALRLSVEHDMPVRECWA